MGDEYRAYREVIAAGLEIMRPGLEVVSAGTGALDGEELGRLDPEVVVCHGPAPAGAGGWLAWVRLPLNPTRPMEVSLHGHRRPAATGPTLGALLAVIDEAERLSRSEHHPGDPPPG
jgi:hypothetical protein